VGGWYVVVEMGRGMGWDGMVVVSLLLILTNGGEVGMGTLWR